MNLVCLLSRNQPTRTGPDERVNQLTQESRKARTFVAGGATSLTLVFVAPHAVPAVWRGLRVVGASFAELTHSQVHRHVRQCAECQSKLATEPEADEALGDADDHTDPRLRSIHAV